MTSLMIFNRPHLLLFYSLPPFRHIPCFFFFFSSNIPTFFRRCTGSPYFSFMEVVKAISRRASLTNKDTALRLEKFTYSYSQLIGSAWHISNILGSGGLDSISREERDQTSSPLKVQISGKDGLKGARIGIVATPSAEFVAGLLGTWLSGGVAVPLALSYPEAELMHVMKDSDIAMILSTEEHQELMKIVAFKCEAEFSLIPPVSSYLLENLELGLDNLCCNIESFKVVEGEEPALIIYTSGTTGKPKGVVHTNKSILSQVQILTEAWEYSSSDQFLNCLPLHHVHGLFNALLAPLYAGSVVEFMPKFSVRGIWQRWRESYPSDGSKVDNAITVFTGVPTMYTRLLQGYEVMNSDMQAASASAACNLRLMMCGSSALPYPVMKQWEAITGHRLLERYGMTEFVMALSNPLRGLRKGGTVGQPLPGVQVKIISEDESGNGTSGVGELCVKSPSLFKEYWKQPKITAESFVDDSFFKTGDSVRVDEEGYYIILGRTNADIMKVGGYKLSALEIEAVLLEHPSVSECCVLGLPDKDYGEVVCAIVVPNANVKKEEEDASQPVISLGELQGWAKDKLAPYKLPTRLFPWDTLPRNAMGKVNKKELKKLLAESYT